MIADPTVRAVPDHIVRVDIPNGWVDLRPMSGNDLIKLSRTDDVAGIYECFGPAIIAHSFGGDFLDQPLTTVNAALKQWRGASEDDALPPDQGES